MKHICKSLFLISLPFMAICCSEPHFKVSGTISDADNASLVLEKADFSGQWIPLDSTRTNSKGAFSITAPAPGAPEIYRLKFRGHYVYFPIDSIENIVIETRADSYAHSFSLSGSPEALQMENFEKRLQEFSPFISNTDSLESFKREVFSKYLQPSPGSVVGYYILTKTVNGIPVFDAEKDYRYFAAVATGFTQYRPHDPRTPLLEQIAKQGRRNHNSQSGLQRVVEAEEINLIEISLPQADGTIASLSRTVGGGTPTLLVFADLSDRSTPALNNQLRNLHSKGIKIYEVGFDGDQLSWRNAVANLPWTNVFGGNLSDLGNVAMAYQVTSLPTLFIIDGEGNLKSRPANSDEAIRALESYR